MQGRFTVSAFLAPVANRGILTQEERRHADAHRSRRAARAASVGRQPRVGNAERREPRRELIEFGDAADRPEAHAVQV
jgi:hypothetical protein